LEPIDGPALECAPAEPYRRRTEEWKKCVLVAPRLSLEVAKHYYSVPVAADPRDRRGANNRHERRDTSTRAVALRATPAGACRTGIRHCRRKCRAHTDATRGTTQDDERGRPRGSGITIALQSRRHEGEAPTPKQGLRACSESDDWRRRRRNGSRPAPCHRWHNAIGAKKLRSVASI